MSRINLKPAATLREPAELVAHGLASAADLPYLEKVAARYAVAVTPDIAGIRLQEIAGRWRSEDI